MVKTVRCYCTWDGIFCMSMQSPAKDYHFGHKLVVSNIHKSVESNTMQVRTCILSGSGLCKAMNNKKRYGQQQLQRHQPKLNRNSKPVARQLMGKQHPHNSTWGSFGIFVRRLYTTHANLDSTLVLVVAIPTHKHGYLEWM